MQWVDRKTYEDEMLKARTTEAQGDRRNYWQGCKRGLRRRFCGENFGTAEEHNLCLSVVDDADRKTAERGKGYRDALQLWWIKR
jgi:hypothetical protein